MLEEPLLERPTREKSGPAETQDEREPVGDHQSVRKTRYGPTYTRELLGY